MATAGFWLRGATGKLAGSALQKGAHGETIIREIVKPTNPQSEAQKIQRVIMKTVMQAYSQLKFITDHSFEGVTPGALSQDKFMAYNLNVVRQKTAREIEEGYDLYSIFAFTPTGVNELAPNEYIVSMGSLPGIPAEYPTGEITGYPANTAFIGFELPTNSYRSILETYGLRRGDQLTLLTINGNTMAQMKFNFARIILDPTNPDGSQASLDSEFILNGAINLPSVRNEGELAAIVYQDEHVYYSYHTGRNVNCGGIIVSRKENDKWLRSNCQMITKWTAIPMDSYSLGYCVDNFASTNINTLNSRMLNNAGTGNVASQGSASQAATFYALSWPSSGTPSATGNTTIVGLQQGEDGFLRGIDANGGIHYIGVGNTSARIYGQFYKNDKTTGELTERPAEFISPFDPEGEPIYAIQSDSAVQMLLDYGFPLVKIYGS